MKNEKKIKIISLVLNFYVFGNKKFINFYITLYSP